MAALFRRMAANVMRVHEVAVLDKETNDCNCSQSLIKTYCYSTKLQQFCKLPVMRRNMYLAF